MRNEQDVRPLQPLTEVDAMRLTLYTWKRMFSLAGKKRRYRAGLKLLPYRYHSAHTSNSCALCDYNAQQKPPEYFEKACVACPMYGQWDSYDAAKGTQLRCFDTGTRYAAWVYSLTHVTDNPAQGTKDVHDNILRVFKEKFPNESPYLKGDADEP